MAGLMSIGAPRRPGAA